MKDIIPFWGRRYSSVNLSEEPAHNNVRRHSTVSVRNGRLYEGTEEEKCGLNLDPTGEIVENYLANVNTRKSLGQNKPSPLNKANSIVDSFFQPRKAGKRARWPKCVFLLMVAGLVGIGAGLFILIVHPYDVIFKMKLVFSDGGEVFELWKEPPVEVYIKIYLFNVTNAAAFLAGKEKLKVEEVGPYVYREVITHSNVTFNGNGTLSAIPKHPLIWVPEKSGDRKEDDLLVLPNIALLSITQVISDANFFKRAGLNALIRNTASQPLVPMTAKEFMFGYKSTLLSLGYSFMSSWIKFDKLGLIDRMYNFDGDYENVYTGEHDARESGLFQTYRGSSNLPQWPASCSSISKASDGTKFISFIKQNESLLLFRKSMCRSQRLVHVGEEVIGGLKAYKYENEPDSLDNGARNPNNTCYCRNGKCLADGLLDVTECYYGFPIALSYPHFYQADPKLVAGVEGSYPNETLHRSFFYINPDSGLPLKVSMRYQINMVFSDISNMAHVERFSNMVLPMLWFDIGVESLPDSLTNRFYLYLNILPVAETVLQYVFFIFGSVVLISSIARVVLTSPYRGKNISENLKQRNIVLGTKTWITDETKNCPKLVQNSHIKGFYHSDNKSPDNLSEKYLGDNLSSVYKPCEETRENYEKPKNVTVWLSLDKINEIKHKIGDIVSDTTAKVDHQKNKVFCSNDNIISSQRPTIRSKSNYEMISDDKELKEIDVLGKKPRIFSKQFSENRSFDANNASAGADSFSSHGTLKFGDVSDKLSDIEIEDFNDNVSECSDDSQYDYREMKPSISG